MTNWIKFVISGGILMIASMTSASDNVTIQLKWVTQTQFAGYYVAQDKGFYKDGIKEGQWMHYNFNGTLMEHSGMYKNGEKIGG